MKKIFWVLLTLALGTGQAAAATCSAGTLGDYLALGSGGCDISSAAGQINVAQFSLLPGPAFATAIAPDDLLVTPVTGSGAPGLLFGSSIGALAGDFFDLVFGFAVSGNGLSSASLLLNNSSASDDGIVTAVQNLCLGAGFAGGPGSCSTSELSQLAFAADFALPGDEAALAAFAPGGLLGVIVDIGVDAGFFGTANFGQLEARFQPAVARVPEPLSSSLALMALGLVAVSRRKHAQL